MRRNVLRFYAVLFFFVFALAAIQFVMLHNPSLSPATGFAVNDSRVATVLTTFPLLALFLLGVLIILLIMQPYSPLPRQKHFELANVRQHHTPHRF